MIDTPCGTSGAAQVIPGQVNNCPI